MTSLLLPSSVALLAHKRLVDAVEELQRKSSTDVFDVGFFSGARTIQVSATERRVLGLAKAALDHFQAGPRVDDAPHSIQVAQGIGKYALVGSAGFDLLGYANLFAPDGPWVADLLRGGTPDPNLSRVVVGTTQLAIRAGELGLSVSTTNEERGRIRAFSMGLLSSVAYGVVADPVLRGLQARRTKREWRRDRPATDIAVAEDRVRAGLLGGGNAGALWQGWWPATSDVPAALLDGYLRAFEEAFGTRAARPKGFFDFEDGFDDGGPVSADRVRSAYAILRQEAASSAWSWPHWYLVLSPLLLMPPIGLIVARALPHSGAFFTQSRSIDDASVFQLLTLGMGLGALATFGYSMFLWSQIPEHRDAFVNALILFFVRAGLVTAGLAAGDASALVRWLFIFTPLIGTDVYAAIRAIRAKLRRQPGSAFVFFLNTLPVMTALQLFLFAGLMKLVGVDSDLAFWLLWGLFTAVMLLAVGLPVSHALSRTAGYASFFLPDPLPEPGSLSTAVTPPVQAALAQLFDESTLWHEPGVGTPTLADLRYPAGLRQLVRFWWTGGGDLQVRHDDHTLTFKKGDGSTVPVVLPPGKLTPADLVTRLKAALAGLEAEVVGPSDPQYDLPFPHALADPGDTLPTLADHEAHKNDFLPVGTDRIGAYVLRHTPRVELTTGYGAGGASRSPLDAIPLVPDGTLADLEETALGIAADLAVLLALGAAPSLSAAPIAPEPLAGGAPVAGTAGPVYQVFRQWNLDERRVNEWRMIVSGGAVSEKGGAPAGRDPAMRPDPAGGAYASRAPEGEPVANAMGWIPLWRAWLRMASDLTANGDAATAMPYTPAVPTRDGNVFQPTNAQLTAGVRFLLDLA